MPNPKTAVVIGGGICGATAGYLLSKAGWKVRVFEKGNCLGGGVRTYYYGGHPFTYGPRPLYTPYEKVFNFLSEFVTLKRIKLFLNTFVEQDGQFYSFPVHQDDIPQMPDAELVQKELAERIPIHESMNFEEYYTASVGRILYDKFINSYSKKMWGVESNTELTDFSWSLKGMALKTGTKQVRDDLIHAHPVNMDGYNPYFEKIKDSFDYTLNCDIQEYDAEKRSIKVNGEWIQGDILVSTTSIDTLMNYRYGELRYIGREFMPVVLPVEQVIPDPIIFLHYAGKERFTRIVEYKKLYRYKSPSTLLGIEMPSMKNKLYPYPIKSEREKAQKYLSHLPENVFSMGRMGRYVYDNIGDVVMQAFELVDQLK